MLRLVPMLHGRSHGPFGRESLATTGYSPFLTFSVPDLDELLPRLLHLGATLDGPIKRPSLGKAAVLRAPDGHMVSIFESAT